MAAPQRRAGGGAAMGMNGTGGRYAPRLNGDAEVRNGGDGEWLFALGASGWAKGQLTDTPTASQKFSIDKITGEFGFALSGSVQIGPTAWSLNLPAPKQPGISEPGIIFDHARPNPF